MPLPITAVNPATAIADVASAAARPSSEASFASVLADAVGRVEQFRAGSEQAIERFLSGEEEDLHKVALATQQADLSFELFLQAKNKVVQAYQEIMRMQV